MTDLTFDVVCPRCGKLLDHIEVQGDLWREAEAWAFLASKRHEASCRIAEPRPHEFPLNHLGITPA